MRLDRKKRRLRVGDRVRFYMGACRYRGLVLEDRGNLGVGGRQLVRVQARAFGPDHFGFEIPAEDCTK